MLLSSKSALAAKIETVYATDSTPTAALNAMQARNIKWKPIVTVREARDLFTPYLGNSKDLVSAFYGQVSFDIELASAGTLGGVPPYDPLFRACGNAQVVEAGVRTLYKPVSSGFDSCTIYGYLDGVLHKITGARGEMEINFEYRKAPMASFNFQGIFVPMADAPFPATWDFSTWNDPKPVTHENLNHFGVFGSLGIVLQSLNYKMNNKVGFRNIINDRGVRITDREPTGRMTIGAELVATKNWANIVRDGTLGVVQLFHGDPAGQILDFTAANVQVTDFEYGEFEGNVMLNLALKYMPSSAGNDELFFVVR